MRATFAVASLVAVASAAQWADANVKTTTTTAVVDPIASTWVDAEIKTSSSTTASTTSSSMVDAEHTWVDAEVPTTTPVVAPTGGHKTHVETATVDVTVTSCAETATACPYKPTGSKTWEDAEISSSVVAPVSSASNTWVDADIPATTPVAPVSSAAANTWADAAIPSTLTPYPTGGKTSAVSTGTGAPVAPYKPSNTDVAAYTGAASSTVASFALAGFAAVAAMIIV